MFLAAPRAVRPEQVWESTKGQSFTSPCHTNLGVTIIQNGVQYLHLLQHMVEICRTVFTVIPPPASAQLSCLSPTQ